MSKLNNRCEKVFVGLAGFLQIQSEWENLANAEGFHFLHFPAWYQAELAERDDTKNVFFVALYSGDRLQAVLPFEKVQLKKGPIALPVMQLFYPNEMGVNDIVVAQNFDLDLRVVSKALAKSAGWFAFIRWQCILASGNAIIPTGVGSHVRMTHDSKYLNFSEGFDNFWSGYSSKFRKGIQKKMRKAEEQGVLTLSVTRDPNELVSAFDTFLKIENSGWKGEKGTSILKQPRKLAYYQSLLAQYGALGLLQINLLYLGDEPIAGQLGVKVKNRLFLLKIGFLEEYSVCSPGYLILFMLVQKMANEGEVSGVSFVTGVDWIDRWHPQKDSVGIAYSDNGSLWSRALVQGLRKAIAIREVRRAKGADETELKSDSDE